MIDLSKYKITIENPKGTYKSFRTEGDPVWSAYPLKGVTYPVDYGCIDGYQAEDGAELDVFVGMGSGDLCGYIVVSRLDVPTETKMFVNVTELELAAIKEVFSPVLIKVEVLDEHFFMKKVEDFAQSKSN
jgi:hypothetical protein